MNQLASTQIVSSKLAVGDRAPDVNLFDDEGRITTLASLWSSRPRVLLFVRHFG